MYTLLADENFPYPSVRELRTAGYDIIAVCKIAPGMPDADVLAWADRDGRVLLTFDKDYIDLALKRKLRLPNLPGIVYFRDRPRSPTEPAMLLIQWFAYPPQARFFCTYEQQQFYARPLP